MPQSSATKSDLQEALKENTRKLIDRVSSEMKENTRDIISHFNQSQGEQNVRLDQMDAKLDAIMEMLATRKELYNLVRALKANGIALEESEIFVL